MQIIKIIFLMQRNMKLKRTKEFPAIPNLILLLQM